MTQDHSARWDRIAPRYDDVSAGLERRFLAASRPWVTGRARDRVLEVGVGTGANLPYYGADIELVGIERSREMLARARERARSLGLEVRLEEGDAGALAFDDDSFDTVVSTYVLCCVTDERRVLAEMVRVLRPGGRLLLADHVVSDRWWVRAGQALLDGVTVPVQGEHFRRRPVTVARQLGLEVVETRRTTLGALERVHACLPGDGGAEA